MNPLLQRLQPYPFERLRQLFAGITPNPAYRPISLGIGEPKHATPDFIKRALADALDTGLTGYPPTAGEPALREAMAGWLQRRYGVTLNPAGQILPVNGSREALFALTQTVVDGSQPGAQLRRGLGQRARRGLGPHPADLHLLTRQPDRCRDAAGRMEEAVRLE